MHGLDEEHEDILVRTLPEGEFLDMVASGRMTNSITLISGLWFSLNVAALRMEWSQGEDQG